MSERTRVDKTAMVLGDTPEARRVSRELLDLDYTVHWALTGESKEGGILGHPRLSTYENFSLIGLDGHVGSYVARLDREGQALSVGVSALVVATGNEHYFPGERYGLSLSSNVLTVSQVENQLDAPRTTGSATTHRNESIILLLDLGGETSKETATETLHLAIRLRKEWHSEVYVFYQDLKVDTPGLERLTREMRQQGIIFCRYGSPELAVSEEGVSIAYEEGAVYGDLLVLPEAVRPRGDTEELAALLGVRVGEDGYFEDVNIHQFRSGISSRRGVFFAGRCYMDCDVRYAEADALQAAANVDALLGTGFLEPEEIIAHVDSAKCIRCLTCVRSCPHGAVEMVEYDGVLASRIVDLACRGCGACVTNCPVQAIELVGQIVPAWLQAV